MNINLDNYEQYLLMYVDNELSAAERLKVEEFLRDYPYLQEELEMLQQTILPVENIAFDKSSLFKELIDEDTQEKLLMHLDGELPAGESLALQNSLKTDKNLEIEWNLLQKTKLDAADIIEYPYKESLYRRERARVVSLKLVRWAAAAMLIGAGFYGAVRWMSDDKATGVEMAANNGKNNGNNVASGNNTAAVEAINNTTQQADANDNTELKIPVVQEDLPQQNDMLAVKENQTGKENTNTTSKQKLLNQTQLTEAAIAATQPKPQNKSAVAEPKELPQRETSLLRNNNDIAAVEPVKNNNSIDLPTNINTTKKEIIDRDLGISGNTYAQTAALGFNDDDNQDQILMMDEENISRSKAGILLKKLKRNVERRANIKPGKSLRIAGFEFAVK